MKNLDRDYLDLICFLVAAALLVFVQFRNVQSGPIYDFASLSAGAALRGFGTDRKD